MKQSNNAGLGAEQRRAARAKSEAVEQAPSGGLERPTATGRAPLADLAPAPEPVIEERAAAKQEDPLAEGVRLARGGYFQEAAEVYRTYLTRHPPDGAARRGLASVLEQRGDFVGALGELGRAIDSQPEDVSLLCARASVQMALQRYDQAEADLRRATKLNADSPDVLHNFGMLFCKKARWREAIEPLQRAVELDPTNSQGHYYLGEAYNQTDQLKLALASYEAAVKQQPTNYRALKGVGIVLDKLGRPAEATAAYQRARDAQRR